MQELNYIRCGDYYIPDIRLYYQCGALNIIRPKVWISSSRRELHAGA